VHEECSVFCISFDAFIISMVAGDMLNDLHQHSSYPIRHVMSLLSGAGNAKGINKTNQAFSFIGFSFEN
jgi:hypothetical protein